MASPFDPPDTLDAASRAIWVDTMQQIMAAGTLTRLDVHSLAAYVQAVANHASATRYITSQGLILTRDGTTHPNPALGIQQSAAKTIATFARQFRLTAAAADAAQPVDAMQPANIPADLPKSRWCPEHDRWECTHQRSRGRGECHGPAVKGADGKPTAGCRMHAGVHVADRLAVQLVRVPTYGAAVKVSAERALMEELWRTAGHVRWLGDRVGELEAAALTWGTTSTVERWWGDSPGSESVAKAGPHILLDLYYRERRHLVDVASRIVSAGLAAKLVDAAQELGSATARVVDVILHGLELTEHQWGLVPAVAPAAFRELLPA